LPDHICNELRSIVLPYKISFQSVQQMKASKQFNNINFPNAALIDVPYYTAGINVQD
jgi:hypothetical protein